MGLSEDLGTAWPLLFAALGALALAAVLRGAALISRILLTGRRQRELFDRIAPVIGTTLVFLYAVLAIGSVFGLSSGLPPLVAAVLIAAFAWIAWPLLRDIIAGVAVKAGRVCRPGDFIDSGRIAGQVTRMGLRVITLETREGEEAIVPYGEVANLTIRRRPVLEGVSLHAFEIAPSADLSPGAVEQRVKEAALCNHWSNVTRDPEIARVAEGRYIITVYSLDERHAPEIENAVRRALATDPDGSARRAVASEP